MSVEQKPLRLAIAGLGTVGSELAKLILQNSNQLSEKAGRWVQIVAVSARDRSKDRGFEKDGLDFFTDPVEMAQQADIDCFVELIGGAQGAAKQSVEAALRRGVSVVTANKALLADHGFALASLAEDNNATIGFEAAVAGGIPVIKAVKEQLAGNEISRIYGILNGTCNYILTRMELEGISFDECLKDAQDLGYAEADPTFDVGGFDAAHKLALLTSLAFGTKPASDQIEVEGITAISSVDISVAEQLGYKIRLLGFAQAGEFGISQRVHPTMVPKSSAIAAISGVTNAVAVEGNYIGQTVLQGPGAGGKATASAVIGDIMDLARGVKLPVFGRRAEQLSDFKRAQASVAARFYLRFEVSDKAGVFAAIASHMAANDISLESIVQRDVIDESALEANAEPAKMIVLVTHGTTKKAMQAAIEAIGKDGYLLNDPQIIRIEEF